MIATLYDKNYTSPPSISDELHSNLGASAYTLGDAQRFFKGSTDFIVRTASGGGGTLLIEDTDYTLNLNSTFTTEADYNVYESITIDNVTYQTGDLYISYKPLFSLIEAETINNIISDITTLQGQTTALNILTKTSDYTILDSDLTSYGSLIIYVNSTSGNVDITLPTLADNQSKKIKIISTDLGGKITIDGEGAETIGGYTELVLQSKNDNLEIIGETGEWQIIKYYAKYETGWQNRADWSDVFPGSSTFDYDNRSSGGANHFTIGEVITETTSGNTGIIQSDTDGASSGTIVVRNVTGTGIWTNNRQITGSTSGTTADVNEVAGSNKNQDTNLVHDFGHDIQDVFVKFLISTDGTQANAFEVSSGFASDNSADYGITLFQVDTDNIRMQCGGGGIPYILQTAQRAILTTEDYYINLTVEVKI